jgi:hypothetical protein
MTAQLDAIAPRVAAPARVGQATAIEQSRAVAEVHGAIVVAQQVPRNISRAVSDMQRSCAQRSLAEKAFFRYSRGGSQISGPSVQLARELARCFGNMQFGLIELRRDDQYGQSEMQAWAWDVQTNTRSSTTFIVQHVRDTKLGTTQLTDQRDIYENNANNGARRLREMIFAILPGWFTEDAVAACYETLSADPDGGTLAESIEKAAALFGKFGVTVMQLEQKLGAPRAKWTPYDLAQLHVIYRSLQRGEVRKEEEFPSERASAADVLATAQTAPAAAVAAPAEQTGDAQPEHNHDEGSCPPDCPHRQHVVVSALAESGDPEQRAAAEEIRQDSGSGTAEAAGTDDGKPAPDPSTTGQRSMITAQFARLGLEEQPQMLAAAAVMAGRRAGISDLSELTGPEALKVRDALKTCKDNGDFVALLVKLGEAKGDEK